MKHLRYLLAMLCLAIGSTAVRAYDLVIDGIYYNILSMDEKTVEVAQAPEGSNYSGPITISGYAITGGVMFQVVGIGNNAFSGSSITSISLPNSVKTIGYNAFWACNELTSIDFGSTGITTIGDYAFSSCYNLTSVTLPSTVTLINGNPFRSCSALDYLYISGGRYKAWDSNGYHCNAIIDTETNTLISGCKNTTIPDDVTTIGECAFECCSSLTNITIPSSVTTIEYEAFNGCSSLTNITIPSSVTTIGRGAFIDCSLTSITIPASVTSIGYWAFMGCNELTSITVEDGNPVYDSREDCNAIIATDTGELIAGCSTTVIPSGVTRIGEAAFSGQYHLNSIVIPEGVTSIGYCAFCNSSLSEVTLPISLTYIDNYAFTSTSLTTINLNCATPPTMEQDAFYDEQKSNITVNVPVGCASLYTSANQWSNFATVNATLVPEWYDFKDGLYYALHSQDDLTLAVRSNPHGVKYSGDIVIPSTRADLTVDAIASAFILCPDLTSVTIPNSVTIIGAHAFMGSNGLTSIDIPASVTGIGSNAFANCSNLNSVTLRNGLERIASEAFSGCTSLESIIIPATVNDIDDYIFDDCTALASITVDENNATYDSRESCNAIIETATNRLVHGCKNTFIPNTVTALGRDAFYGRTTLTEISIPTSVTSMEENVFYNTGLASIVVPSSITHIGNNAFANCQNLVKADIRSTYSNPSVSYYGDWESTNTEDGTTSSTTYYIDVEPYSLLDFNFTVSSEENCDKLIVTLDGNQIVNISGEVSSTFTRMFYETKTLTLEVSYTKDGSVSNGEDKATVTNIRVSNHTYGLAAFNGCPNLTQVKVAVSDPAPITAGVFNYRTNATLYVPQGARNNYLAMEYWQDFQQIKEYPDHDVNQDGEVDVVDVVDIARYVVGTPRTEFEEFLADVNGNNRVNVNDAVAIVNEIVGDPYFVKAEMAPTSAMNDQLTLAQLEEDGSLSLQLSGSTGFTAFQMNLHATEAEVEEMVLNAERKNGQQLLYNKVEEGVYRIAALSTSNRTLRQSEGEVLNIRLDYAGADDIRLTDILFVTPQGQEIAFPDLTLGTTTAIRDIATEDEKASGTSTHDKSIYDLSGRRLQQTQRGLNIVGGKKVVVK